MENTSDSSNWIPTSFVGTSEVGEGDSFCSFQSAATPGSAVIDAQSDDPSLDNLCRQKSNLTDNEIKADETSSSKNATPTIAFEEEDTRSAWSVEPPAHQSPTEFKENEFKEKQNSTEFNDNEFKEKHNTDFKDNEFKEKQNTEFTNNEFIEPQNSTEFNDNEFKEPQNSTEFNDNEFKEPQNSTELKDNEFNEKQNSDIGEEMTPHIDETSQNSVSSRKSGKRRISDDEESSSKLSSVNFQPENLFEYMWPQEKGQYYILQEQISDFLNVKSFKRKYPDLTRRPVDADEKQFLKSRKAVSEMQCDLGLTALRSEEVLELMSKEHPEQFKEYVRVLREKQQQKHREYAATHSDKTKAVDLVKKAVQSAADYNAHLNQERRDERRSCMDLQTFTIHYPARKNRPKVDTKPGKYPIALLPGQYQDYYKEYTPNELKYLPLNTVLYGPLRDLQGAAPLSDGSPSDSDESTASDGSCCSSSQGGDSSSASSEKANSDPPYRPKVKPNAVCKVCKRGLERSIGVEELVHCADCDNSVHPSCVELGTEAALVLQHYPWQCMDCKVCSHCRDPGDEDKMLFCDICDRGYHTFCVGLKALPQGKWVCRRCGSCSLCGSTHPGPEASSKLQWQYDLPKGEQDANRRPKILCQACFKKKR